MQTGIVLYKFPPAHTRESISFLILGIYIEYF